MTSWDQFFHDLGPQRIPAVWKRPVAWSPLTAEEALSLLAKACTLGTAKEAANADFKIRFFRDGVMSNLDSPLAPRRTDASPEGYVERLRALTPSPSVGLVLNEYHCLDAELWYRIRGFFRAWFEHTGMPAGGATADIFLANYPTTPFGIHRDEQDVFTWVVSGRKRFLVWPPEAFDGKDMRSLDLDRHRNQATILEGEPGDLMFWPSTHWHVGESVGDPAVTLSLGRFMDSADEVVHEEAIRFFDRRNTTEGLDGTSDVFRMDHREPLTLPEPLRDAADHVLLELEDAIHRRWLARLSNVGLPPPPPCPTPLPATVRLGADPAYPILWAESNGGFLIAGAGRTLVVSGAPWIPALLDALNRGVPTTPHALLDELHYDACDPAWRKRAWETIAELYAFRALLAFE